MTRYNKNGSGMLKALGQMVGLLLSLYVFDQIITSIAPSLWSCTTGFTVNTTGSTLTSGVCYNLTNITHTATATGSTWFSTTNDFLGNLFPVIGILAAFEIIYRALKRANLV